MGLLESVAPLMKENSTIITLAATTTRFMNLFVTDDGRIGRILFPLVAGDVLVVLLGGKVPFVLRPCKEHYLLLGECCECCDTCDKGHILTRRTDVPGIMHGEMMKELDEGKRQLQDFALH